MHLGRIRLNPMPAAATAFVKLDKLCPIRLWDVKRLQNVFWNELKWIRCIYLLVTKLDILCTRPPYHSVQTENTNFGIRFFSYVEWTTVLLVWSYHNQSKRRSAFHLWWVFFGWPEKRSSTEEPHGLATNPTGVWPFKTFDIGAYPDSIC